MDPRMADAAYATRQNGRTRAAIEDGITGTTKNTPQRRHAQSQDKHSTGVVVNSLQLPKPAFADEQERSLLLPKEHPHPGPSRFGAIAQEYRGTEWNLRGFSRTGSPVAMTHRRLVGCNKGH
jgi:hypothetical protein